MLGKGLIELSGSQINFYTGVGYWNSGAHSIFQYDNSSNKIFFVNTSGGSTSTKIFLFSFDTTQYISQYPILQNNSDYLDINNVTALITANTDILFLIQPR